MNILLGYLLLNVCLVALHLWGCGEVKRFLATYATIADAAALDAFKRLARRNMYGALVFLGGAFFSVPCGLWIGHKLGLVGYLFAVIVVSIIFLLAYHGKALENKVRSLDCPDPVLREEYARVSKSWVKKPWPDF